MTKKQIDIKNVINKYKLKVQSWKTKSRKSLRKQKQKTKEWEIQVNK